LQTERTPKLPRQNHAYIRGFGAWLSDSHSGDRQFFRFLGQSLAFGKATNNGKTTCQKEHHYSNDRHAGAMSLLAGF
jgi:hypothetical protein